MEGQGRQSELGKTHTATGLEGLTDDSLVGDTRNEHIHAREKYTKKRQAKDKLGHFCSSNFKEVQ